MDLTLCKLRSEFYLKFLSGVERTFAVIRWLSQTGSGGTHFKVLQFYFISFLFFDTQWVENIHFPFIPWGSFIQHTFWNKDTFYHRWSTTYYIFRPKLQNKIKLKWNEMKFKDSTILSSFYDVWGLEYCEMPTENRQDDKIDLSNFLISYFIINN